MKKGKIAAEFPEEDDVEFDEELNDILDEDEL